MKALTDAELKAAAYELAVRSTRAQGLPLLVEDPLVLQRVVTLVRPRPAARKRVAS